MPVKILITSAGAGPAVAVIKALMAQKTMDLEIISVDRDPLAAGLYLSDRHYLVPSAEEKDYLCKIIDICKKEDIKIIIPIFDTETIIFANETERFEKLGIKALISAPEIVEIANDKIKTYKFCMENNIPAPKIYSLDEVKSGKLKFPVLLKPQMGVGTKGIFKIGNRKELDARLPLGNDYFVQEYIDGVEYTIDTISDKDGKVLAVVPRERIVVKDGQMVKGRTVNDPRLIKYGRDAAGKFGIKWAACLQCKVTDKGEMFFIEINPRYGTGVSLSIGAGLNFPLIQVKLALGIPVKKEELEFTDNFYMIRYWEEIFRPGKTLYGR